MESRATLNNLRISPRKARLVADMVRGQPVQKALDSLQFSRKRSGLPIKKLIESAIANAENNHGLDVDILVVKEIWVDPGRTMKRFQPRAQGRAFMIRKRTSHVRVVLAER